MNKINPPTSDKKALRIIVQEQIAQMSTSEREKESQNVCHQLIQELKTRNYKSIVGYSAFDDEINISGVLAWCEKRGIKTFIIPQSTESIKIPKDSLLIVPGRAFTKEGKRIGRGSGYYDKLIEKYPETPTIGVCFSCQLLTEIPEENWDKRVDKVVFAGNTLE